MHKFIKKQYRTLIKQGWKLYEIDKTDIFYLFDLYEEEKVVYAEQVPWL